MEKVKPRYLLGVRTWYIWRAWSKRRDVLTFVGRDGYTYWFDDQRSGSRVGWSEDQMLANINKGVLRPFSLDTVRLEDIAGKIDKLDLPDGFKKAFERMIA